MRLNNNKFNANINMDIALPDFVNKNEILSKRLMENFMNDVSDLQSKYSFDSIAYDMRVSQMTIVFVFIKQNSLPTSQSREYPKMWHASRTFSLNLATAMN